MATVTNHLSISIFLLYSTVKEKKNTFARVKIITSDHRFLILFMNPFLSFDQRRQGLISFPAFWIISRYSFTMPGWIKSTGYETYARLFIIISTLSTFSYLHFPTLKDNYVTSYRSIYAGITQLVLYRLNLTNKFDSNLTFNSNFFALNLFDSITCYIYWIENVSQRQTKGRREREIESVRTINRNTPLLASDRIIVVLP